MSTSSKYKFIDYIAKQMKSVRQIFHTNIMYIKASTGIKISSFFFFFFFCENGGKEPMDHKIGL